MINKDMVDKLNELGFGGDVDKLEEYIAGLQNSAACGEPEVQDNVYDMYVKILRELKPDSYVLTRNWEIDDEDYTTYDDILKSYGMKSIMTIKEMSELENFRKTMESNEAEYTMLASTKLNGHAVRAVYVNGELIGGSTRGRSKRGRDISKTLKRILPNHISSWENYPLVEVRGEALVSYKNFEKVKHILKTPLSSVTSFIRESATDNEVQMLDVVCYKVIVGDDIEKQQFNSLEEEYKELQNNGFKIPVYKIYSGINAENFNSKITEIINDFQALKPGFEYDTDGIVVAVNNDKEFYALGANGNTWFGNFALKMGDCWGTKVYTSVVNEIEWVYGKSYITPKAHITPVKTANGSTVSVVPLYNVGVMERLNITTGSIVFFMYGGETGVSLCDSKGNKISELAS